MAETKKGDQATRETQLDRIEKQLDELIRKNNLVIRSLNQRRG